MNKVVLDLLNTKPLEKYEMAFHVLKSLNGNSDYPNPNPPLADLQNGIDDLLKAIEAVTDAKEQLKAAVDQQREASAVIVDLLQRTSSYVQSASGGDKQKIISAGFKVKKEKGYVQRPPIVENFRAELIRKPGQIMLRWKRMLKSQNIKFYQVRYTYSINDNTRWETYEDMTTQSKMLFISSRPGVKVWIQVRACNSAGFGPWSNPVGMVSFVED